MEQIRVVHASELNRKQKAEFVTMTEEFLKSVIPGGTHERPTFEESCFVAFSGKTMVGFVAYDVLNGNLRLQSMFVRPGFRNKNIARALVSHAKQDLMPKVISWHRIKNRRDVKQIVRKKIQRRKI